MKQSSAAERRREAQRDDVRQEILDAARDLVDKRGPHALTMRAVAGAVGYSPAALYEYFASKDHILQQMYFQGSRGLEGRTRQVVAAAGPNASTVDCIGLAGRAYRSFALEHSDLYLLTFSVRGTREGALPESEADDASFGLLVKMIGEGIERGEIAGGEPVQLAAALWAFVHGFVMLEITGRLPHDPPGVSDMLFEAGLAVINFGLLTRDDTHVKDGST
jgi:AcrR family transcriptional regulator